MRIVELQKLLGEDACGEERSEQKEKGNHCSGVIIFVVASHVIRPAFVGSIHLEEAFVVLRLRILFQYKFEAYIILNYHTNLWNVHVLFKNIVSYFVYFPKFNTYSYISNNS